MERNGTERNGTDSNMRDARRDGGELGADDEVRHAVLRRVAHVRVARLRAQQRAERSRAAVRAAEPARGRARGELHRAERAAEARR